MGFAGNGMQNMCLTVKCVCPAGGTAEAEDEGDTAMGGALGMLSSLTSVMQSTVRTQIQYGTQHPPHRAAHPSTPHHITPNHRAAHITPCIAPHHITPNHREAHHTSPHHTKPQGKHIPAHQTIQHHKKSKFLKSHFPGLEKSWKSVNTLKTL